MRSSTARVALGTAGLVGALALLGCTSSSTDAGGSDVTVESTTTTLAGGSGPAVRVPSNEPGELARLFAAWAIPQGADGYVGPCESDQATASPATTWCSVEVASGVDGQVFEMFHPGSAGPSAAVLIAPADGFYRIEDSFSYGDGTPPEWVPASG